MKGIMSGWVKLHRKILDNNFLMHDRTAFDVFVKLLLLVDFSTGEWSGGTFQLANSLGYATPTTAYRAVKRLETQRVVQRLVQRGYTTIRICKWPEYQASSNDQRNGSRNPDATQTQTSTQTLIRSKEVKKKRKEDFLENGTNPLYREWCFSGKLEGISFETWIQRIFKK
ncbi:MAG: hypothetical protein QME66_04325 [Candidatus Eisenbacteria bacterium]|nr:hypothetical protein [Candidatus Eisenbacteria bacterium]